VTGFTAVHYSLSSNEPDQNVTNRTSQALAEPHRTNRAIQIKLSGGHNPPRFTPWGFQLPSRRRGSHIVLRRLAAAFFLRTHYGPSV